MAQKYPTQFRHAVTVLVPEDPSMPSGVALTMVGERVGPEPVHAAITVGEAYELGRDLVGVVDAMLAGSQRPWDADPGRVPFASRGRREAGRAARHAAGHADRASAPAIRPTPPSASAE